jgi:hypothetical protein
MMVTAMPMLSGLFQQRRAHPTWFEPRLEVRSGLHRGARIKLCSRSYCVGSATGADIVLRDADIAPRHALLHLEGGNVKIEARDGNVVVGSRVLAEGYACYLRLPAELALGNINLRVVAAPRPPAAGIVAQVGNSMMKSIAGGPTALFVVVSLQLLVLSLVAGMFPASTKSPTSLLFVRRGSCDCSDVARRRAGPPSPVHLIRDKVRMLRKRPDLAGVPGLTVAGDEDRISDTGAPSAVDIRARTSMQPWFDEIYRSPTGAPPLRLDAVWSGEGAVLR